MFYEWYDVKGGGPIADFATEDELFECLKQNLIDFGESALYGTGVLCYDSYLGLTMHISPDEIVDWVKQKL